MVLINDILERVKQQIGKKSDAAIARALGIESKNPSAYVKNWRDRGTIPWAELCNFAIKQKISLDWLLTGEEKTGKPEKWEYKFIVESLEARLNDHKLIIEGITYVVGRYKTEVEEMWKVINTKDAFLATANKSIADINDRLLSIKARMIDAAERNDVRALGEKSEAGG